MKPKFKYIAKERVISSGSAADYADWNLNPSVIPPGRVDSNSFYTSLVRMDRPFLVPTGNIHNKINGFLQVLTLRDPNGMYSRKLIDVWGLGNFSDNDMSDYLNPPGIYQFDYQQPLSDLINNLLTPLGAGEIEIVLRWVEMNSNY